MSKESLSALMDGECRGDDLERLLAHVERNPEFGQAWSRMCLQRDLREGTRVTDPKRCIVSGVMAGITQSAPATSANVVSLATFRARLKRVAWKPVAGFAAAASMGAAAVLVLHPTPEAGLTASPTSMPGGGLIPAAIPAAGGRVGGGTLQSVSNNPDAEQMEMLREYLINHSDSVSGQGVGGALYYTRFAAHTGQQVTAEDRR